MDTYFHLDQIDANPWQPRDGEDEEHIEKLAASILSDGLMQVPVGRIVGDRTGTEWRVQLAFGHSRLAAFGVLRCTDHPGFELMPVVIRELSDEEMFRLAISENVQRRDLSPMEEARAMLRFRDEFGKTSSEIGELFGLAESSVRNKIRLLGLPVDLRQAAQDGRLSEGAARELLSLFELPEAVQKQAKNVRDASTFGWTDVVEQALRGRPADDIRGLITKAVQEVGNDLSAAKWKWDAVYDLGIEGNASETCKGCAFHVTREKKDWCVNKRCWITREQLLKLEILARASAATGIRPSEDLTKSEYEFSKLETDKAKEIRASGCDSLRLVYVDSVPTHKQAMMVDGHPQVQVMCNRRNGQCTCANGIDARAKLAAAGIRVEKPVGGQMPTVTIDRREAERAGALPGQMRMTSAQDLKDLASQARRAKSQLREEVKAMQDDFAKRVARAFENRNGRVMAELLLTFVYSTERYKYQDAMAEEILYKATLHLAESLYDLNYYTTPDLGDAVKRFNEFLRGAKLTEMALAVETGEPVYEAIEETERPAPVFEGKRLVEVFEAQEEAEARREMDAAVDAMAARRLPGQAEGETLVDYFARGGDYA